MQLGCHMKPPGSAMFNATQKWFYNLLLSADGRGAIFTPKGTNQHVTLVERAEGSL